MLPGYHWLVFYLSIFCVEIGYPLEAGGLLLGVLRCQMLEVWAELNILGEMVIIYQIYYFPIFCVS